MAARHSKCHRRGGKFHAFQSRWVQGLQQNTMFKRVLERNIEIMGEAVNRILLLVPDISISSARRIVDARNFIIHEYEKVSDEVLWAIAVRHIPLLKVEVEKLLAERA